MAKVENSGWAKVAEPQSEFAIPQVSMFPTAEPAKVGETPFPPSVPRANAQPQAELHMPPSARIDTTMAAYPATSLRQETPAASPRAASGDRSTVAVVGCGTMGRSIAQLAAVAGHPVLLFDADPRAVEAAIQTIGDSFRRAV